MPLRDQIAVVTGAADGLSKAITFRLAEEGAGLAAGSDLALSMLPTLCFSG
jgi:NAD(P)-dependent dehydrogenase (short-subunit alcohol dehydrogenase family)